MGGYLERPDCNRHKEHSRLHHKVSITGIGNDGIVLRWVTNGTIDWVEDLHRRRWHSHLRELEHNRHRLRAELVHQLHQGE